MIIIVFQSNVVLYDLKMLYLKEITDSATRIIVEYLSMTSSRHFCTFCSVLLPASLLLWIKQEQHMFILTFTNLSAASIICLYHMAYFLYNNAGLYCVWTEQMCSVKMVWSILRGWKRKRKKKEKKCRWHFCNMFFFYRTFFLSLFMSFENIN